MVQGTSVMYVLVNVTGETDEMLIVQGQARDSVRLANLGKKR